MTARSTPPESPPQNRVEPTVVLNVERRALLHGFASAAQPFEPLESRPTYATITGGNEPDEPRGASRGEVVVVKRRSWIPIARVLEPPVRVNPSPAEILGADGLRR